MAKRNANLAPSILTFQSPGNWVAYPSLSTGWKIGCPEGVE